MQTSDEDPEIPVSMDDFTVIDPSTGEAFDARDRDQLAKDIDHPSLLSVAPSDPSGIRGVQADLKTFQALGAHGCSVITGIAGSEVMFDSEHLEQQWAISETDAPPLGIKLSGELSASTLQWLGEKLSTQEIYTVVIPDLDRDKTSEEILTNWRFYLLPYISVLILSREEASILSGQPCNSLEDVESCAEVLLQFGCRSALIMEKPLSSSGKDPVCDFWSNGTQSAWLRSQGVAGSERQDGHWDVLGCALTFYQVQAYHELDTLILARMTAQQSLKQRYPLGEQRETVWTSGSLTRKDLIPELAETLPLRPKNTFCAPLLNLSPGWIPIVSKAEELTPLFENGATTAVLHIPNENHPRLDDEIQAAIEISDRFEGQLFIQKHWKQSLTHDAFGVLLHASELEDAEIENIANSGLRLGVIVKSYTDLAAAIYCSPSCIIIEPPTLAGTAGENPELGIDFFEGLRNLIPVPVFASGQIDNDHRDSLQQAGSDGYLFSVNQIPEEETRERMASQKPTPIENNEAI